MSVRLRFSKVQRLAISAIIYGSLQQTMVECIKKLTLITSVLLCIIYSLYFLRITLICWYLENVLEVLVLKIIGSI